MSKKSNQIIYKNTKTVFNCCHASKHDVSGIRIRLFPYTGNFCFTFFAEAAGNIVFKDAVLVAADEHCFTGRTDCVLALLARGIADIYKFNPGIQGNLPGLP